MNTFKKLLLDIIPVVVGILLALILNGIVEDFRSKKYFRQSLQAIVEENDHNIKEIEYALERQKVFRDTLFHYYESDTLALIDITIRAQGFYSPDLKLTSWKFLLEDSKHTLIPFEMINKLTEIEKHYNIISTRVKMVTELFYEENYFDKSATKLPMLVMVNDFKEDEMNMLEVLQEFDKYVEEQDF